ncbi:DUF4352 domain-containing protein [Microbispora bryophytorum]|uniref:DUF4352 domain-containing protein n=1 Tax=Microbispora bryophytorum TaxID=1460882 RepID=UPI0033E49E53
MTEHPPAGQQPDPRQYPQQPYPYQGPGGPQPQQYGQPAYGPPPGYGYPPQPQPPKKSNTGLIVLAVIGGICLVLFAGCAALVALSGSSGPDVVTATAPADTTAAKPQQTTDDGQAEGQEQADTQGGAQQPAHVGGTLSLKGFQGLQVDVTVTKVELKATPANDFLKPKDGNRFVAIELKLDNKGQATYEDSPSNGAVVVDDQGQQYRTTFAEVKEGQAFQGSVTMSSGDSRKGVIVFEVPEGAKLAKLQFALNSGFSDQKGEWVLS